jgi:hypothetical protein
MSPAAGDADACARRAELVADTVAMSAETMHVQERTDKGRCFMRMCLQQASSTKRADSRQCCERSWRTLARAEPAAARAHCRVQKQRSIHNISTATTSHSSPGGLRVGSTDVIRSENCERLFAVDGHIEHRATLRDGGIMDDNSPCKPRQQSAYMSAHIARQGDGCRQASVATCRSVRALPTTAATDMKHE